MALVCVFLYGRLFAVKMRQSRVEGRGILLDSTQGLLDGLGLMSKENAQGVSQGSMMLLRYIILKVV